MKKSRCPGLLAWATVLVAVSPAWARGVELLEFRRPKSATQFELWELRVDLPGQLPQLRAFPPTQIHDAHDADRDGRYVRLSATFSGPDGARVTVPGFAVRERAGGPWEWRVRWAPRRPGQWKAWVDVEMGWSKDDKPTRVGQVVHPPLSVGPGRAPGPLVAPAHDDSAGYLRRLRPEGGSEAVWLFGACRAWVVQSQDRFNDWYPHEWLDRETELLAPMRDGGFNLLNQWMAPWEFLLVHHDQAERWKQADGTWKRVPLPKEAAWTPYQCFDQGRAMAFDQLVRQCEGGKGKPPICLLLSPLPHQCVQLKEHPWGAQESGWSPDNDAGKQSRERLNGFSGFRPKMSVWDFFGADPRRPLDDWRSQLFDHQANYYRYLIARWGYSSAIGMWVIVDELDAVGDVVGVMADKTGWWGHPQCDRWLADVFRLFRGQLTRSDGLRYQGDPFKHPLHAATTSFGGESGRGGNLDWPGGPPDARPDLFGWHWYPWWKRGSTWTDIWTAMVDGVASYATAPIGDAPRLISEFGAADRDRPTDPPSFLYPTLYHHAIWAAVFNGHAGTPMDWDDGKQFGELRWRKRKGIFSRAHYPIDHVAQLKALRAFVGSATPDTLRPCRGLQAQVRCAGRGTTRAFALYSTDIRGSVLGWIFAPGGAGSAALSGLPAGAYRLVWHDPWTGRPVPKLAPTRLRADGKSSVILDAGPALAVLRAAAPKFPKESREARGFDVAFKLLPEAR